MAQSLHTERSRYFIEAVGRGIDVLQIVAQSPEPLTISEIAKRTGGLASTVLQFVETLRSLNFIEEGVVSGTYQPGRAAIRTGFLAMRGSPLQAIAYSVLRKLFDTLDETVNMAVLDGFSIVVLHRFKRAEMRSIGVHVGTRVPAHCTALGLSILAQYSVAEVRERYADYDFGLYPETAISSLSKLVQTLKITRTQGYAVKDDELVRGHRAVAVPLFDCGGRICGSIGTVRVRTNDSEAEELKAKHAAALQAAAQEIGRLLPSGIQY